VLRAADDELERRRIEADIAMRGTTASEQSQAIRAMFGQFAREAAPGRERQAQILKHGWRNVGAGLRTLPPSGGLPAKGSGITAELRATLEGRGYKDLQPAREIPAEPGEFE